MKLILYTTLITLIVFAFIMYMGGEGVDPWLEELNHPIN